MTSLKKIINSDTKAGKIFDLTIQALILISLISFSIETIPHLNKEILFWLYVIEVVIVALFTIEYGLRILYANHRINYIFSFYGIVDLTAILPFYISTGVDLRSVRILRFFRVFRVLKILRYTKAIQRFKDAYHEVRDELTIYLIATAMLLYLSSVGIYYFEEEAQPENFGSVFHCLWWAIVTLTTVGYGDVYPVTIGGRIFTAFVMIIGIGVVAVPTGLFASALTRTRDKSEQAHEKHQNE